MIDNAVKIFWVELCWTPLKFCWRIKQNRNNRIALIIIYRLIMFALQTRIESSAEGCWGTNLNERGRQKKCWSACWCNSSGYIVFTHDAHMYPWHSYICTTIPSPMVHIHYLIQRNLSFLHDDWRPPRPPCYSYICIMIPYDTRPPGISTFQWFTWNSFFHVPGHPPPWYLYIC